MKDSRKKPPLCHGIQVVCWNYNHGVNFNIAFYRVFTSKPGSFELRLQSSNTSCLRSSHSKHFMQEIPFQQFNTPYLPGEEEILFQKDLALKSRVLDPGMGVERAGDFRSGVLLDITANCSVKLVGTNVKVSNVPGSILTPWNVSFYLQSLWKCFFKFLHFLWSNLKSYL